MSYKEHVCGVFCDPDTRTHSTRHDKPATAPETTVTFTYKVTFNGNALSDEEILRAARESALAAGVQTRFCDVSIVRHGVR